jgi:hypothetical protein
MIIIVSLGHQQRLFEEKRRDFDSDGGGEGNIIQLACSSAPVQALCLDFDIYEGTCSTQTNSGEA